MIYLLRVDFNVESARDALRLEASLPTIKYLLKKKNSRVVILSHRGRPEGRNSKLSLAFAMPFLAKRLKEPITFLKYIPERLPPRGRLFLMENLRFWHGEDANDLGFAKKLAKLGDYYINDAFAVSHRKNASITRLPGLLPSSMGLLLQKEIRVLSRVMKNPKRPLVLIFGGAKVDDKLSVIKNLLPKSNRILLGSSVLNNSGTPKSPKILSPVDWIRDGGKAMDIGPLTAEIFSEIIKKARTIIWNGPVGKFEDKKYAHGSIVIAKAIARSRAFSIIGGGETTQLFLQLGLRNRVGFLSTGGGAMLEFLAGKTLPGLEVLK